MEGKQQPVGKPMLNQPTLPAEAGVKQLFQNLCEHPESFAKATKHLQHELHCPACVLQRHAVAWEPASANCPPSSGLCLGPRASPSHLAWNFVPEADSRYIALNFWGLQFLRGHDPKQGAAHACVRGCPRFALQKEAAD